jgi:transcriptional regulator with XRE-family HTH domain
MVNDLNIKKQFGQSVATHRNKLSLSQEEFATRCGLHRTYVGDIERGKRNVGLINIIRIATALGVPPSSLLDNIK